MKKLLKILVPMLALAPCAMADETGVTVTPKGSFDFSVGAQKDNGPADQKYITANRKGFGFFSSAGVSVNVENRLEQNLAYGAKVALATSTAYDRKVPTMMYFESSAGKIEVGSDKSATTKMKITGLSNTSGSGGMWDMWVRADIRQRNVPYITNTGNFLDTKTRSGTDLEYARKITYFTPEFKGFQVGVSYTPDTTNSGHKTLKDPEYHMTKMTPGYNFDIKDGISWGLSHKYKVDDDLSFRSSVVGEFGKVVARDAATKAIPKKDVKFKNLRTYTVGAEVKYTKFALSGCYSNYMKSLTSNLDQPGHKKSDVYSVGAKYSLDQLSFSLHQFMSNNRGDKANATTIAMDYKVAPGLMPYAEVTAFSTKGRYKDKDTGGYFQDKHRGFLVLTGVRLEF